MTAARESLASGRLCSGLRRVLLVTGTARNTFPVSAAPRRVRRLRRPRRPTITLHLGRRGRARSASRVGRCALESARGRRSGSRGHARVRRREHGALPPAVHSRRRGGRRDRRGADRHGDAGRRLADADVLRSAPRRGHAGSPRRRDGRLRPRPRPVDDHAMAGGRRWPHTWSLWRPDSWPGRLLPRRLGPVGRRRRRCRRDGAARAARCRRPRLGSCSWFTMPPMFGGLATTQHTLDLTERGFSADAAPRPCSGSGASWRRAGRVLFGLMSDGRAPRAGFVSFGFTFLGLAVPARPGSVPAPILAYGYVLFLFLPMGSRATIGSVLVGRIAPLTTESSSGCSASATASDPRSDRSLRGAPRLDRLLPRDLPSRDRPRGRGRRRPGDALPHDAGVTRVTRRSA